MEYRHTQVGYLGPVGLVLMAATALFALAVIPGPDDLAGAVVTALALLAIGGAVFWFNRLTVVVTDGRVRAWFGASWPRKTFDLVEVAGVRPVRNRWYYGWGIRKIPKGWMYNVWGLDAVELELDSGRVFRIGTDEPEALATALSVQLPRR